jgi:hypothetical protein
LTRILRFSLVGIQIIAVAVYLELFDQTVGPCILLVGVGVNAVNNLQMTL